MSNRRDFLKVSLIAAATAGLAGSVPAFAEAVKLPKGLIYTKDDPGMWAKKVKLHVPDVKVADGKVTIKTFHPMTAEHYIVRHTLVSEKGKVLGDKTFAPTDKVPQSQFEAPAEPGIYFATSFCNQHDFWVTEFKI